MRAFRGVQKPYNHVCLLLVILVVNGQATWIKMVKGLGFYGHNSASVPDKL